MIANCFCVPQRSGLCTNLLFFCFFGVLGFFGGLCLWYMFLILFSFAGIFVSESKGAILAFFKILIISFVLCVKARYAFCHVFVFLGT